MGYSKFLKIAVTPTIGTDAYTANDVVGGLLSFSLAGLSVNGGLINSVILVDDDNEGAALTLYLFDSVPSTIADDAAFAPTVADLKSLVGAVALSTYVTLNSNKYSRVTDINDAFVSTNGNLYGYLVCTATPTYAAATDLTITLYVVSDQ